MKEKDLTKPEPAERGIPSRFRGRNVSFAQFFLLFVILSIMTISSNKRISRLNSEIHELKVSLDAVNSRSEEIESRLNKLELRVFGSIEDSGKRYVEFSKRIDCRQNLRRIQDAKERWVVDEQKEFEATSLKSDLYGRGRYILVEPACPSGGMYSINAARVFPTCSIEGHSL